MRLILVICAVFFSSIISLAQDNAPKTESNAYFIKGGIGTSWIIMPKVFLVNPGDTSSAQILPAINGLTSYIGFQTIVPLGKNWLFMPEININYIAGEVRVNRTKTNTASQKLQAYTRIELPLNFGVVSADNFWVSFGPVLFFTLSDNKGFDTAVNEVVNTNPPPTEPFNLNSDNPVGLRFRLATYIVIGEGMYIDLKFDSDLKRNFNFNESENTYNMIMSLQSITVGFGYRLNR